MVDFLHIELSQWYSYHISLFLFIRFIIQLDIYRLIIKIILTDFFSKQIQLMQFEMYHLSSEKP